MQVFLPENSFADCAKVLDQKRLVKQLLEGRQIMTILAGGSPGGAWKNHPAVKMWKGYERFLLFYLYTIMYEWESRGFKNEKCKIHFYRLKDKIYGKKLVNLFNVKSPYWLNNIFCKSHQSNLLRKDFNYYKNFFPNVKNNLPYIWPVK